MCLSRIDKDVGKTTKLYPLPHSAFFVSLFLREKKLRDVAYVVKDLVPDLTLF